MQHSSDPGKALMRSKHLVVIIVYPTTLASFFLVRDYRIPVIGD